jgi:hypothetical protein
MASRLGHKTTGIHAGVANWTAGISVRLFWNEQHEEDWAQISIAGNTAYYGPFKALHDPVAARAFIIEYLSKGLGGQ